MKNIVKVQIGVVFFVVLISVLAFSYKVYIYDNDPEVIYKKDKNSLEKAISIDTLEIYQDFLDKHPNSAWRKNFIYYRDRAALRIAQEKDTPEAYQSFIDTHLGSDWIQKAIYYQYKASMKYGPPDGQVVSNDIIDVDYKTSAIDAHDRSKVNLKSGADIKILSLYGNSQVYTSIGMKRIEHMNLYNQAVAIIDGGDTIGFLSLNDESTSEIFFIDNLHWLIMSGRSLVHVYGCNFKFEGGYLSGAWKENGSAFKFRVIKIPIDENIAIDGVLPDNVILHECEKKY